MTPGYILNLPQNRREIFNFNVPFIHEFAEPVVDFSSKISFPYLVLIGQENKLTHIGKGKGGKRAGTNLRRMNIENIEPLKVSIPFDSIFQICAKKFLKSIEGLFKKGGPIPTKTFEEIIRCLIVIDPDLEVVLHSYLLPRQSLGDWDPSVRKSLSYQKEAINTALHLTDLDRSPLQTWSSSRSTKPYNFLDGLDQIYLREDQMISSDLNILPGFHKIREFKYSRAQFRSDDRKIVLDVLVAHRTRLEEQTGVDLIYYNEKYQSFILVQYKVMEHEVGLGSAFRLPNAQLQKEIANMELLRQHLGDNIVSHHSHYRLTYNPFFIKICSRLDFDPNNINLTHGMYINLDHWKVMENDASLIGQMGGRIITFGNVERHITNSDFATLVRHSWIGTTPTQSVKLEKLIVEILKTGKSVVYAVKRNV